MFAEIGDSQRQYSVLFENRLQNLVRANGGAANTFVCIHQIRPELQKGPTCGFAVLLMALHRSEQLTLDLLVEMGKEFGITFNGELFSAEWMCEFVEMHWPNEYELKVSQFPTPNAIVRHLFSGKQTDHRCPSTLLVPYDCDKNFEPCNRDGNAAHWAIIIGFVIFDESAQNGETQHLGPKIAHFNEKDFVDFDREHLLYLVALQGKSRHPALWSYKALRESNEQLNVPNPSGNFRLPPEGMAAIMGKCIFFGGPKGDG